MFVSLKISTNTTIRPSVDFGTFIRRYKLAIAGAVSALLIALGAFMPYAASAAPMTDNQWVYISNCTKPMTASAEAKTCTVGDKAGYGERISVMPVNLVAIEEGWVLLAESPDTNYRLVQNNTKFTGVR